MLGNAVKKFFSGKGYFVEVTDFRYGTEDFEKFILESSSEFIINCIGKIPQKKQIDFSINKDLPIFLEKTNKKILHPSTDCEFSGSLEYPLKYSKLSMRDAFDVYGLSKLEISQKIENDFKNTKIIRVSIIGHELKSSVSLLDWFLSQDGEVFGYVNHYWNGITTLQWAEIAENIINNWEKYPRLNQFGTGDQNSKYDLLCIIKDVYKKDILVHPKQTEVSINKMLISDVEIETIENQLKKLKDFYKK